MRRGGEEEIGVQAADINNKPQSCENTAKEVTLNAFSRCVTFEGVVCVSKTNVILDTGAGISLMSIEFLNQFCKSCDYFKNEENLHVKTATGQFVNVIDSAFIEVNINGEKWFYTVYVADNLTFNLLLGTDLMLQAGVKIDFSRLLTKIGLQEVNISIGQAREIVGPPSTSSYLLHDVEIPARCEIVIPAGLTGWRENDTGLIEPLLSKQNEHGALTARALVTVNNDGQVPLKLINPLDEPIKMYSGPHVATIESYRDSETDASGPVLGKQSDPNKFNFNENVTANERETLFALSNEYRDVFLEDDFDLGHASNFSHRISRGNHQPIRQRPYRTPETVNNVIDEQVNKMLKHKTIQPSQSPWSSNVVIVRKKDGKPRFCIDYRKLNSITKKDVYPLPRISEVLDSLGNAKYFSTMDLASGYWQVPLEEENREKTAFIKKRGLFEFLVLPISLVNSPPQFQRMMDIVLSGLQWENCLVYLDDVIVYSRTFEDHLKHLTVVFDRLRNEGLKLKPRKCEFCKFEVNYLGHVISSEGLKPDPSKLEAIQNYPIPNNVTELRSVMGLFSNYRRFVKDFSTIAAPLHKLLNKGEKYQWNAECQRAFEILRSKLTEPPILSYPDFSKPFVLYTDAATSNGVGAVLAQEIDGKETVIGYASRSFKKNEKNYPEIEAELLAIVWAIKYFRPYLYGRKFVIITDHNPLR